RLSCSWSASEFCWSFAWALYDVGVPSRLASKSKVVAMACNIRKPGRPGWLPVRVLECAMNVSLESTECLDCNRLPVPAANVWAERTRALRPETQRIFGVMDPG